MRCPHCQKDNDRVVDSRLTSEGGVIRRRRECLVCFLRFTTYERIEETPLRVVKKSGERVRFDRDRILGGMLRACEKLQVPVERLEQVTIAIESKIHEGYDREVPSTVIGSLVMEELRAVDPVAYVRFASVYREFRDIKQFLDELKPMMEGAADSLGEGDQA
ncbi:MAG: transcriptional repressor NrdR [Candidatus Paceibacteria bacterium]|jgi:transcriptional repressor NrdR